MGVWRERKITVEQAHAFGGPAPLKAGTSPASGGTSEKGEKGKEE